jgi:aspartyl protease family protein
MDWKHFLPFFAVALAIGWFVPADEQEVVPPKAVAVPIVSEQIDDVEDTDRVALTRQVDGHFYTEVEVGSGSVRFLVDTGATAVALTGDDARELGLHWSEDELGPVARGASGMVRGKVIVIDRMQLGNVEARNVRAAIIPEGLDVSLLGQTFLSQISSVNISGNQMVLRART